MTFLATAPLPTSIDGTTWDALPGLHDGPMTEGYVYLVRFSDTLIKAGRTRNPVQRLNTHDIMGRGRKVRITNWWISPLTPEFDKAERMLLEQIARVASLTIKGELFAGCELHQLVEIADRVVAGIAAEQQRRADVVDQLTAASQRAEHLIGVYQRKGLDWEQIARRFAYQIANA